MSKSDDASKPRPRAAAVAPDDKLRDERPTYLKTAEASGYYTEEMRERARRRIERKRESEDPVELYAAYMRVMFSTFLKRIDKAAKSEEGRQVVDAAPPPPTVARPRSPRRLPEKP